MSTGSFLQVAAAALNIVPEYPVGIAIYSTKKDVALTSLTGHSNQCRNSRRNLHRVYIGLELNRWCERR